MPVPVPATITDQIVSEAQELLKTSEHYVAADDFTYSRLLREARKLFNVDPATAHLVLAFIMQLEGNLDQVQNHLDNARQLRAPALAIAETALTCHMNLGMFSKAKACYIESADPRDGIFTRVFDRGLSVGAFRAMLEFEEVATKMQLDLAELKTRVELHKVVDVLAKTGTSEDEATALLDLAGEVLRKHRLFFLGIAPRVDILDEDALDHCVFVNFTVAAGAETAATMMDELALLAATRLSRIPPGFSVGFTNSHL